MAHLKADNLVVMSSRWQHGLFQTSVSLKRSPISDYPGQATIVNIPEHEAWGTHIVGSAFRGGQPAGWKPKTQSA